jgi:hypothetical protein
MNDQQMTTHSKGHIGQTIDDGVGEVDEWMLVSYFWRAINVAVVSNLLYFFK